MTHPYPKQFPQESRARVLAEMIVAAREFEAAKQKSRCRSDEEDVLSSYILRVFLVFVREGRQLVSQGIWNVIRLDSESREFLRRFTISVQYEKCYSSGRRIGSMVSNGNILPSIERMFEKSPLWHEYEDLLLGLAVAPATSGQCASQDVASGEPLTRGAKVNWEDIEITFLSDERIQVTAGKRAETLNYAEMGFEDQRSCKPNQGWGMLRTLAQAGGVIPNSARNSKDFIAMGKRIERLRKALKGHFQIASDPIPLDPVKGYGCRFKLGRGRSFDT